MLSHAAILLAMVFTPSLFVCGGNSESGHTDKPEGDIHRDTALSCKIGPNGDGDLEDVVVYYNGRRVDAVTFLSWRNERDDSGKASYDLSDLSFYLDGHKIGRGTSAIDEFYRRLERLPIGSTVIAVDPNWKGTKYTPFTPFIPYLCHRKHLKVYPRIKAKRKLEFHAFPMTDDLRKRVYGKQGKKKVPAG